ncbi:hypothetical protein DFH08DRAFT_820398 [Mycena albidolilacea]|uniref:Uncharacterized protein n=1 Tax=Mycena albidolilacea TaxID=1033008 RepID=A0AAD7EE36_9AGAR|nr:hypothetical protein DFH08DRAFT_820398 [Mycena albidolilacea]
MSTPNLEGRPNPGVLRHRCWLICKSEEHPTKGGLSNAIDGTGSFDVVKDGGHRLMVLIVLASSTTASTDVEQLKMGPNDKHSTSAMDGGTSGLDIVDNSEHLICSEKSLGIVDNSELTDTMRGASGLDVINDRVARQAGGTMFPPDPPPLA